MATPDVNISPLTQLMRRIDARVDGVPPIDSVPTGFPSVDRILGSGLRKGDLVVLGGDVGSGKSSLALAITVRAAMTGEQAVFYSGEMSTERVHERMLAFESRTRIDDLRRGTLDENTRLGLGAVTHTMRDLPPLADRLPDTVDGIREAVATARPRLVVVDPIQCLAVGKLPLDEEIAAAVRGLKRLATDYDVVVFATAHLPRLTRDRQDLRPTLDDFGALHAVKQHADVVLGLFREEMYGNSPGVEGATELHVLKNRSGATGYVDLYFYKQWLRFEDLLDPDP
jgi:replicative DNA helicase